MYRKPTEVRRNKAAWLEASGRSALRPYVGPWTRYDGLDAVLALGASVVNVLLLTIALLRPTPFRVEVGEPGDAYVVASFHRPEGRFRWSAPGSALLVPAAYDGPLAVELRLHAAPAAGPDEHILRLGRDGATVAAVATTPEWRVYRLLLPPDAAPEGLEVRVERLDLEVPPSYAAGDARPLGVALDTVGVGPAPGAAPAGQALGRAAAVAWGLGLVWITAALIGGWRHPAATALPILICGAGLALWAWRAPLGFAWSIPTPPWWLLGVGSLALVVPAGSPCRVRDEGRRTKDEGRALSGLRPSSLVVGPRLRWRLALAVLPLAALGLLLPPPWSAGAALILALLPGTLGAWALFPDERSLAARVFLGTCGAVAGAAVLMLALDALPGAPPAWLTVGVAVALSAALAATLARAEARTPHTPSAARGADPWAGPVALALLAGAGLRLWALGSAEFQGDEARAMLLALGAARGEDGLLLTHTKGPVEALLPAAVIVATGAVSEWSARLPFALASLGVLAGALDLARRFARADERPKTKDEGMATPSVSLLADAGGAAFVLRPSSFVTVSLLAVDGFAVAFGRIVQYQSLVMLMMLGAFWCCWRFYAGAEQPRRHLTAAATLLSVGLLAHYDAAFVAPALAWLVVAGGLRRGWRPAEWARALWLPVALGAGLLASFYVPYVTSPGFAETAAYLAGRAGQGDAGGPPFNNLALYYNILAFYNAPPLAPVLVGLVVSSLSGLMLFYVKPKSIGLALGLALIAATLVQWLAPGAFALVGEASWAGLAFGLPLLGLCALPGVPGYVRATALWFTAALCGQAFLIAEPRTHFYTAHVPAALLVGLALGSVQAHNAQRETKSGAAPWHASLSRWAAAGLSALLLLGGGAYATLVYLRQLPEYQRQFPAARPDWLRGPYGDTLPEAGYFGFPHRDGWKAAAELLRAGELAGSYGSNQNRWLVGWYLGGLAQACTGQPDLYLIAEGEPTVYYPPGAPMIAEVTVGPGRAMAIYRRDEPVGPARRVPLESLAAAFDARPLAERDAGALLNGVVPDCE